MHKSMLGKHEISLKTIPKRVLKSMRENTQTAIKPSKNHSEN